MVGFRSLPEEEERLSKPADTIALLALALLASACPGPTAPAPFLAPAAGAWAGVPRVPPVPEIVERERCEEW